MKLVLRTGVRRIRSSVTTPWYGIDWSEWLPANASATIAAPASGDLCNTTLMLLLPVANIG